MFQNAHKMFQFVKMAELLHHKMVWEIRTNNQKNIYWFTINHIHTNNSIALNGKTKLSLVTKITVAIIINFIYYRHSVLNVCLPLFQPDASHPVFLPFFTQL